MSRAEVASRSPGAGELRRFAAPALLLGLEFVALSLVVDFPMAGPSLGLVNAVRMLVPAVLGAGSAGILIAWHHGADARAALGSLPAPRVAPALVAHLAAFAGTAASGYHLMGPGAGPLPVATFVAWFALVGLTVLLAVAIAAPPLAVLRLAATHLGTPLFAVGVGLVSWRAVVAAEQMWGLLQSGTLRATAALLDLVSGPVHLEPARSLIGLGSFDVAVAPVCSGADGVGLVLLFQAVWLSIARGRIRVGRAFLLLAPVGILAALAANVLRIGTLILVGAAGHEEFAVGAFHSKLGWILFIGIAFASIAAAEHLRWLRRAAPSELEAGLPATTAAYVGPLLAALVAALVTGLWARQGFDPLYGARVIAATLVLLAARRSLPRIALSPSWKPFALAALVTAFWVPLAGAPGSTLGETVHALDPGARAAWIALRLLGACLVLPIAEELAFRGFLLPWLLSADFERVPARSWSWLAVGLSSVAFGALHDQWMLGTAAGVVFALARVWRGSLGDAIVAHVACNTAISLFVLVGGRWELWG